MAVSCGHFYYKTGQKMSKMHYICPWNEVCAEKISQETFLEILNKLLGTLQKVPRNKLLFTWLQTSKRNDLLTWHKTQDSAMFLRTFPGIETASSSDLCPACQGLGGGSWNCQGTLGAKELVGRLGVFVMSLWQCWLIQLEFENSKNSGNFRSATFLT